MLFPTEKFQGVKQVKLQTFCKDIESLTLSLPPYLISTNASQNEISFAKVFREANFMYIHENGAQKPL